MNKFKFKLFTVVILLMAVSTAKAITKKGDVSLIINFGISGPITQQEYSLLQLGEDETVGLPALCFGAQFIYNPFPFFGVGIDFTNAAFKKNEYVKDVIYVYDKPRVWTMMPVIKITPFYQYKAMPYFIMGVGYAYVGRDWQWKGRTASESAPGFATMIGAGFDLDISNKVFIGSEIRWVNISTNEDTLGLIGVSEFTLDEFTFYTITGHIGLKFGK